MHIHRSALFKQHRVQHYAAANDAFDFFNMLTSPDLLDTLETSLPEHRERLFPPTETLSWETHSMARISCWPNAVRAAWTDCLNNKACANTTSKSALKDLYKRRWQVELDIRNIKPTLGMETLSCKTPEMGEKELWVYLLAYNLIRLVMAQSALVADVLPRALSFKHTLQLWLVWSGMSAREDDEDNLKKLLALKCMIVKTCFLSADRWLDKSSP